METQTEAKLRLANARIADLEYELRTMRGSVPKRPWRWAKKYQMAGGLRHWCLESVSQPDNGVGDGRDRTVGLILLDSWSEQPTPLMLHVADLINR